MKEGYQRLTTTRVAERAGVSVGTLYQYFPDKRSLVTALKVRYFGLMMEAVAGSVQGSELTLENGVRRALEALVRVKRDNLALTRALREPMVELGGQSFVHETLAQFVALLVPAIASALPSLDHVERRATLLVAAIEGAVSYAVFEEPRWLEEPWLVDELTAVALGYLRSGEISRAAPAT